VALLIAHRPLGRGAGRLMLFSVAGFALCLILFGISKIFWISCLLLLLAGMFDEVSVFVRSSLVQRLTPENMKGRVSSVNSIFITSSNELGAFESGVAAHAMGTEASVVLGGAIALMAVGVTWWKAPRLRDLNFETLK
jgi:predicted MFS family arabinose efflux permease